MSDRATRAAAAHVVCDATRRGMFVCRHCGEEYLPNFPIKLSLFTALCRAFVREHRGCEARVEGASA